MTVVPDERAVTIAGPARSIDVRIPTGVPVADLLPQLARAVGASRGELGWELVPIGGEALPLASTLSAVADGDVLHLRAPHPAERPPDVRSVRDRLEGRPDTNGRSRAPGWSELVTAVMTAALVLPVGAVALLGLAAPSSRPQLPSASVAFVLGAVLLALLGGWLAMRDPVGPPSPDDGSAGWPVPATVAGAAGLAWSAIAGGGLVALTAPGASGPAVAGGGVVVALIGAVLGGWWAARRRPGAQGFGLLACGGYGLSSAGAAALLAVGLGGEAAARLVALFAALSIGMLPGVAVVVGGATRLDRSAVGGGLPAAVADGVAARSAALVRGSLVGAVLVATLALASRWPQAGPVDTVTAASVALLFAGRVRTVGHRFAGVPIAGAAMTAVLAIGMTTIGAPADRLLVTLAAVVVGLGVLRVGLDHRRPPSPVTAAHGTRLVRWSERALIVVAIPLAGGVLDGVTAAWGIR